MASEHQDPLKGFLYRVEVYLTLTDKHGELIQSSKLRAVAIDIYRKFGGLTMTAIEGTPVYEGYWHSSTRGKIMHEKTSVLTVLVPQAPESTDFFIDNKTLWIDSLNYDELLITMDEVRCL